MNGRFFDFSRVAAARRVLPAALGIVVLSTGAGYGEPQYDDPAVAVCEWDMKRGIPDEGRYERLDAKVEGRVVTITYKITYLNVRPETRTRTCDFGLRYGRFEIAVEPIPEACSRTGTLQSRMLARLGLIDDRELDLERECREAAGRNAADENRAREFREALERYRFYPIDPAATALQHDSEGGFDGVVGEGGGAQREADPVTR